MYRKEVILGIGLVERECRAAVFSVSDALARSRTDPTILREPSVTQGELRLCRDNVENTYLIRMFAVFEEALREMRQVVFGKKGAIKTYQLLQQCASRQHVPHDELNNAHQVREYRNSIVHGGDAAPVTLAQARAWLCTFFSRMPPQW